MKQTRKTDRLSHWSYSIAPTHDADAYKYPCTRCDALAGDPCTYVSMPTFKDRFRLGKPTSRPHYERIYWVRKERHLAEQERLRAWLLAYVDIFQEEA